MPHHLVRQGECLSRIARDFGFSDYRIIYDHSENAEFKRRRPNPNLIFPGDRIYIPEREAKEVELSTDAVHHLEIEIPKRRLQVRVLDMLGEPLRDTPYTLDLGADRLEDRTDADGVLEAMIPLSTEDAMLSIDGMSWALRVGHLNPVDDVDDDVSGLQARLRNLGYDPGPLDGRLGKRTRAAIRAFQAARGLEVDGACSTALIKAVKQAHGS